MPGVAHASASSWNSWAGFAERVVPLVMTSRDGARLLRMADRKAKLVYIDGSHMEEDVVDDLEDYWPLVETGGILFGDDYPMPAVKKAVEGFCDFHGLHAEIAGSNGQFFVIRKGKTMGQFLAG